MREKCTSWAGPCLLLFSPLLGLILLQCLHVFHWWWEIVKESDHLYIPKYGTIVKNLCVGFGDVFGFAVLIQTEVDPFIDATDHFGNRIWVLREPCLEDIFFSSTSSIFLWFLGQENFSSQRIIQLKLGRLKDGRRYLQCTLGLLLLSWWVSPVISATCQNLSRNKELFHCAVCWCGGFLVMWW